MDRYEIRAGILIALLATSRLFAVERGSVPDPGSVLLFPAVEVKWREIPNSPRQPYAVVMDTIVQIENDGPGPVSLHLFYVNGDAPTPADAGWNRSECHVLLDGGQTLQFSAALGDVGGVCEPFANLDGGAPPGRPEREAKLQGTRMLRGYVLVWAENAQGHEIRWNYLSGRATLVHYEAATVANYPAYSFVACPTDGNPCADGEEPDAVPGRIWLDGVEYSSAHRGLTFDFFGGGVAWMQHALTTVSRDFEITMMPVSNDLRASATRPLTVDTKFEIANEYGSHFSGPSRCVTGWFQVYASRFPDILDPYSFSLYSLGTDTGRAWVASTTSDRCWESRPFAIAGVVTELAVYSNARTGKGFATDARILLGTEPAAALIRYDVPDGAGRSDEPDDFGPGPLD